MKVSVFDRAGNERVLDKRIADLLERKGKVTYQTRMMQAEPVTTRVATDSHAPSDKKLEPISTGGRDVASYNTKDAKAAELDSAGQAWDEHMHVSTKLKNADGTWRKRPGARLADE